MLPLQYSEDKRARERSARLLEIPLDTMRQRRRIPSSGASFRQYPPLPESGHARPDEQLKYFSPRDVDCGSLQAWILSHHSYGQRGYKLIKKFSMMQLLIWLTISSLRELIICI